MSKNAKMADNQQGSHQLFWLVDPSETTRRHPFSKKVIVAYLLGAIHDGTFSCNKRFRISQKGTEWLVFLKCLFRQIGYNSWLYQEGKERKIYVLETLADFLDFKFDPLIAETIDEKIAYLRGFFDAEGGIPHKRKDRFYIQLTQNDKVKLEKLKVILAEVNIATGKIHNPSYRVNPSYWRMYILANSCKDFVKKVGSWHPEKIHILRERMMI